MEQKARQSNTLRREWKAPDRAALYAVTERLEPAIHRVEEAERRLLECLGIRR